MKNDKLKQIGWRDGMKYVGDIMTYASMCYETFNDFASHEDFNIMDDYQSKKEPYQNEGKYIVLNRALADYVSDIPISHTIKLVRFPDRNAIPEQFKVVDSIIFHPDRIDDVTTHLTNQMKKIRETFSHNKTNIL